MTVFEWRRKHPKCKYCVHLRHMMFPPYCLGRDTWCNAKEKIVDEDLPRPFCRLFEARED